ncbi:uncharacterized protein DS421_19g647180 [Arachis hypogaea]|uniref:Uncharacterized protein n=1 Tax=Arachis hypogaea TaxID=3818 RepID=A0A6B9V8V5_ARAHY|nr:uncharacterized protein DS421_19g647180 [Arachis hypogaea]
MLHPSLESFNAPQIINLDTNGPPSTLFRRIKILFHHVKYDTYSTLEPKRKVKFSSGSSSSLTSLIRSLNLFSSILDSKLR